MLKLAKRLGGLVFLTVLILGLSACAGNKAVVSTDILTQKVTPPDKIQVTVLVKNAFSIKAFEKAAELRFPELDIIQVGNYTSDMGIAEYESRLRHGDLTDIVMTWPLDVGEDYWADQLLDLSSLPFTGEYATAMLNNISREGQLFYLPGPSQVRGILYNKTLFQEKGWEVPQDFQGFVALCQEIEDSGVRSLQLGLGNPEVLDTAFVGYGYEASFSKPSNAQALTEYDQGKGSFADNFGPALEIFQTLIDEGVLQKADLGVDYAKREEMFFNRQCAMVEDSVLMARMGMAYNGCQDEFALMPFFVPGKTSSDWARLYPVCYIGVNKQLAEPANQKKYDLVMALLAYISTAEGQVDLAADTGAMFSSLKKVALPDIPEIKDLVPALTEGRYAIFPTLNNSQGALRTGLAGMVAGEMTASQVVKMVDKQNVSPPVSQIPSVLGSATADFTLMETGNFVTDAMAEVSGCEIALFLDGGKDGQSNGKGIGARLYQGELSQVDIKRILPDLRLGEKGELLKITMTGADLITTLEHSIVVNNNQNGWFYYFSGLKMDYAPTAKAGERIRKITDSAGKTIDPARVYSIAVMDETVPEELMKTCENTGLFINQILADAITAKKQITPSGDGRFVVY